MMRACVTTTTLVLALLGVLPQPALALDLEGALREVAAANPRLAAHDAWVEAARHRVGSAGAWPAPMLELGVINVPTSGRFDVDPMTMKMIGISQAVPVFGRIGLSRRAAMRAWQAAGAAAELATYELLGEAWQAYIDAFFAHELVRSEGQHRAVLDRMVKTALAGYATGRGGHHEVVRAQAERARVLAELAGFRAEELSARARLSVLMGRASFAPGEGLFPPPISGVPEDSAAWLATVTPEHPRLRRLADEAERYALAARAARRSLWPDLEMRGSYGVREDLLAGHGTVKQEPMFSASVGLALLLFAGRSPRAEGAELEAMARASRAERDAAELELRGELLALHAMARSAQHRYRLLADTVVVAQRRWLESAWSAYATGEIDMARVLEAGHALVAEEIAVIRARHRLSSTQARLVALTGRGDLLGVRMPEIRAGKP